MLIEPKGKSREPFSIGSVHRVLVSAIQITTLCVGLLFSVPLQAAPSLDNLLAMDLVVHFIDVGVGDAIFIELPGSDDEVVIDGGDRNLGYNFLNYIGPYIDDIPIRLAIVTHSDFDHWSGIERLLDEGHRVSEIWDPGYDRDCKFTGARAMQKKQRDQYLRFIHTLPRDGMRMRRPVPVDPVNPLLQLDQVKFWVLHAESSPPKEDCAMMINDSSIVVRMQYKNVVFLFTGDANGKERADPADVQPSHVEGDLLRLEAEHPGILKADVLKVPHHGSNTASTREFVEAVSPRFAVISSSVAGKSHLPTERTIETYEDVRFGRSRHIEKLLRTDHGESGDWRSNYGSGHIVCGTNGESTDLVCDYLDKFEQ